MSLPIRKFERSSVDWTSVMNEFPIISQRSLTQRSETRYVGLTVADCYAQYSNSRAVTIDGVHQNVIQNMDPKRLNLVIDKGIVTDAFWG